jgi:prepilin-type N-terminal cleavage/methylation domain-containing protein
VSRPREEKAVKERNRGFTLVELLIAMSLFVVLSTALIALLTQAFDFLRVGTAGSEVSDKGSDFLRPFRADLENVIVERSLEPGSARIRFLCDGIPFDSDGDGNVDYLAQRLAFVRSTREELADPVTRLAGTNPAATQVIDGKNDYDEAKAGELRAAGGMMEVLYIAIPDDPENDPGLLTLYRATRMPVGGSGSLLDPQTVRSMDDVRRVAEPFVAGVLYFGVEFSTPEGSSVGGTIRTWDSTRGILERGKKMNQFPFGKGPESLDDPRDDISPRTVIVTFVFGRTGGEEEAIYLDGGLSESATSVRVSSTAFANRSEEPYIKVGTEWMSWATRTRTEFKGLSRGQRGTFPVAQGMSDDVIVRAGYTVRRTITIPAYREDYNQ